MNFKAKLLQAGKTATGIEVPENVVLSFDAGKRIKVTATLNGYAYRTSVAPYQGKYMLPVSADVRAKANIAAGQTVEVALALDTAPREVTVPADFAKALKTSPVAKKNFEALAFSHQSQHVLAIEGAKAAETRARRIEKAIAMLVAGKKK
jgi:hypothetical protein